MFYLYGYPDRFAGNFKLFVSIRFEKAEKTPGRRAAERRKGTPGKRGEEVEEAGSIGRYRYATSA